MKKYYWILDCKRGDLFEERLDGIVTNEDAIYTAWAEWDRLTIYDQREREYFELILAPEDEYGNPDLDKCELIARFC